MNKQESIEDEKRHTRFKAEMDRLSHEQREIIRQTFEMMTAEAPRNGLTLFVRLFAEFPHYKNIWPQFEAIADSSLVSSDQLQNHAKVYMAGLKSIVAKIDDDEELMRATRRIAAKHCKWHITKQHIQHMVPELLFVLEKCDGQPLKPEVVAAWTLLYDIIGNMLNILLEEERIKQRIFY